MIIMFALTMTVSARSALSIIKEAARQRSIIRGVERIEGASDSIMKEVSAVAQVAGEEQYSQLLELVTVEDDSRLSERDLEGYFRVGYCNKIKKKLGDDSTQICDNLNSFIKNAGLENVTVVDEKKTKIEEETGSDGTPTVLRIRNVTIRYEDKLTGGRTDTLSYNICFPDAVFHPGNDELFRYCMVARKGIYITGRTSSVIGDVFAGSHRPEECREAEIIYGETGTYGGINILSTQLGMKSDRIVSEGDININGSFVIFDSNNENLECYAQRINEIEGFSKDAKYTLEGDFFPTTGMDEAASQVYHESVNLVSNSLEVLDPSSIYYDSDNDRNYTGKYRKLISGSDVEIKDDFTGIIATRANVIIQKDVNVEGVILCGDRIYAMGNNNIVANPSVARTIIASENAGGEYTFRVSDYIGGMKAAGLTEPDYYVIPYR